MKEACIIGLDFGTDSARAVVVNAHTGEEVANSSSAFRRWKEKQFCEPVTSQYRQHSSDFLEAMEHVLQTCIRTVRPDVASAIKPLVQMLQDQHQWR